MENVNYLRELHTQFPEKLGEWRLPCNISTRWSLTRFLSICSQLLGSVFSRTMACKESYNGLPRFPDLSSKQLIFGTSLVNSLFNSIQKYWRFMAPDYTVMSEINSRDFWKCKERICKQSLYLPGTSWCEIWGFTSYFSNK